MIAMIALLGKFAIIDSTSVFIVPGELVKNREERLIVLNQVAKSVVEEVRGVNPDYVFTYKGHPIQKMNNGAWKRA
jgi:integrase